MKKGKGRKTRFPGVFIVRSGVYWIRAQRFDPLTGKKGDVTETISATSTEEASRRRDELILGAHDERDTRIPTVDEFAATLWLPSKIPTLKPSTRRHYAELLDLHILPIFGEVLLDKVTRRHILTWRERMGGANATKNSRFRVLRTLFRDASAEFEFPDPTARIRALPQHHDASRKVLTREEVRTFVQAMETVAPSWLPITLMLLETGARWGAISALHWDDVNLDRRVLHLRRAHSRGCVSTLKTGKWRSVPISDDLRTVLLAHRQRLLADQAPGVAKGLVFPSTVGGYMQPSSFRKPARKAAEAAGFPAERIPSAHWLRYTMNNLLRQVASGEVQRAITGHSTLSMAEHYSHVDIEEKRSAQHRALQLIERGTSGGTSES